MVKFELLHKKSKAIIAKKKPIYYSSLKFLKWFEEIECKAQLVILLQKALPVLHHRIQCGERRHEGCSEARQFLCLPSFSSQRVKYL